MDITPISSSSNNPELVAILVEIRDTLSDKISGGQLSDLESRLWMKSSPEQIMHFLVPLLLFAVKDLQEISAGVETTGISCHDALKILGLLVSPSTTTKASSHSMHYLETASHVICSELKSFQGTSSNVREKNKTARELCISNELLSVLVHQACTGWNVKVAQNCHESLLLLFRLCPQTHAIIPFFWTEMMSIWSTALQVLLDQKSQANTSTVCIRCATLTVDIAVMNDHFMQLAIDALALDLLLKLFQVTKGDPLSQISLLELFQTLASTYPLHALRCTWLLSDKVMPMLLHIVGIGLEGEDVGLDPYLQGPALRVLASLCGCLIVTLNGEDRNNNGRIQDRWVHDLLRVLSKFDVTAGELEHLAFIDAVSSLASTSSAALNLILDNSTICDTWLNLSVAQPKIKSAVMVSIAHVMDSDLDKGMEISNAILNDLWMKLYATLGLVNSSPNYHDSTELLLNLVRSPIPEICFGVYQLFQVVARNSLGGQVLMNHPLFFQFLLSSDHFVEPTYEGRILKHAIVEAIYGNSKLQALLSNEISIQLTQRISEGPHSKNVLQWDIVTADQ